MSYRIPNSKPWITPDDVIAVSRVVHAAGWGEQPGSEVAAFERELAEFLGRKYVVCVSSGTAALELALRADGPQDYGYVGAFGFVATANAVEREWGAVIFEDRACDNLLGEMTPHPREDVVDACQAFGAKLPPSLADCFSFNFNKPITCLGGGCMATDDSELADLVAQYRNQGRLDGYGCVRLGTNARMSDMQAALGRSQLRRVGEILERRRRVAHWYWDMLTNPSAPGPYVQFAPRSESRDSWFLYPIELSNRDEVHAKMLERGIQTRSCADWLLPKHPYYAERYQYKRGMFPEAERRADRTLLLPLFPEMTLEQVQEVCKALEECDAAA